MKGYSPESKYYENNDTLFNKNKVSSYSKNKDFDEKTYDEKDEDIFSFINTLSLDNYTKKILITKINKLVDNIKYEPQSEVKEHFSPYYIQNENKSIDLLFLVLLGLFLIFIMEKK